MINIPYGTLLLTLIYKMNITIYAYTKTHNVTNLRLMYFNIAQIVVVPAVANILHLLCKIHMNTNRRRNIVSYINPPLLTLFLLFYILILFNNFCIICLFDMYGMFRYFVECVEERVDSIVFVSI